MDVSGKIRNVSADGQHGLLVTLEADIVDAPSLVVGARVHVTEDLEVRERFLRARELLVRQIRGEAGRYEDLIARGLGVEYHEKWAEMVQELREEADDLEGLQAADPCQCEVRCAPSCADREWPEHCRLGYKPKGTLDANDLPIPVSTWAGGCSACRGPCRFRFEAYHSPSVCLNRDDSSCADCGHDGHTTDDDCPGGTTATPTREDPILECVVGSLYCDGSSCGACQRTKGGSTPKGPDVVCSCQAGNPYVKATRNVTCPVHGRPRNDVPRSEPLDPALRIWGCPCLYCRQP